MSEGQERCAITNKLIFTKDGAHRFLAAYGRSKGAKRSYRNCGFCGGYHTTKTTQFRGRGKR